MLDHKEGVYSSFLADDELLIIRAIDVDRQELVTTDKLLATGTWIAVQLEEFGDTLVERYAQFKKTK